MCKMLEDMRNEVAREVAKEVAKETAKKTTRETAARMIKMGKLTLEEIAAYVPSLSLDELKELEAEVMQMA